MCTLAPSKQKSPHSEYGCTREFEILPYFTPSTACALTRVLPYRREHSSAAIACSIRAAPGAVHKTGHARGRRFHAPDSQCAFKRFAGLGHHWHWQNFPHATIAFAACNNRMTGHTDTFIDRIIGAGIDKCGPKSRAPLSRGHEGTRPKCQGGGP